MNKKRDEHSAVVCNGDIYVVGGYSEGLHMNCLERIDADDLLQSSSTPSSSTKSHWTTFPCRLSTERRMCCAVAVQSRYIVVLGGYTNRCLSSVEIIDTCNNIVIEGPSLTISRRQCSSAVIGHRIFVVGGQNENGNLNSVEYLDYATPCDNDEAKKETGLTFISFSPIWTTHSELRLSNARSSCTMVAVGSCLVEAGGWNLSMEVMDTIRNRMCNSPLLANTRDGCTMVTVANQVAVIGGWGFPSCATLRLMDKNTWSFCRLCEQPRNEWYHCQERSGNGDVNEISCTSLTSARNRLRTNT